MKILHTSDWHLGKRLDDFSRLDEQREVMQEICEIAEHEKVDAVVIAGDLFDTFNPSVEAIDLFYKTLKKLSDNGRRAVIAIAGNHDSPDRIEAPDPLAKENGIFFLGYPHTKISEILLDSGVAISKSDKGFLEFKLPGCNYPLRILTTPYANESRLKIFLGLEDAEEELRTVLNNSWKKLADDYCDDKGVNILVSHLFFMKKGGPKPEEPEDEKPILHMGGAQVIYTEDIPSQIQYSAFGHLHRRQIVDDTEGPAIYSGSPIAYSFSEANQDKFVEIIEIEPGQKAKLTSVKLSKGKRLLRKRFDDIEEATQWLLENQDSLVELTMVSDDFLTSTQRKQLANAHPGIIALIPELTNAAATEDEDAGIIDLKQDIRQLFASYFKHKHAQEPNDEIMDLFNEVLSQKN